MDTNGNNGRAAFVTAGTLLISAGKIVTVADITTTDAEPAVAMVEAANTGASEPPEDLLDAMVASGCRRSVLLFNTDHDFKRRVMRKVAEVFGARTDVPLAERVEAYAVALQAETGQPVERLDHPQWPPQIVRRLMEHVADIEMGEPDEGGQA